MTPDAYLRQLVHAWTSDVTAATEALLQTTTFINPVVFVAAAGLALLYAGLLGLSIRSESSRLRGRSHTAPQPLLRPARPLTR